MKNKKEFLVPGSNLGYLVHYLDTQLKIGAQRIFTAKGFNFTSVQFGILSLLWQEEGLHQSELARKSGKDRHNMTRLLNLFEKGEYIRRKPDLTDKRRYNIFLTKEGKAILRKLTPIFADFMEEVLTGVSSDDLQQMRRIQDHIIKNLEKISDRERR